MNRCRLPMLLAILALVLGAACGDTAEAPTAPPATGTVGETLTSPTAGSANATMTSDADSATPVAGANYELVARWGEPAPVLVPNSVAVLPDGSVAITDLEGNRIAVFGPDGELESTWSAEGIWNLAAGPEGQLYALRSRGGPPILAYDRDGALLRQIEIPVDTSDSRLNITGMAVSPDGSIFVASGLEAGTGISPTPFSGVLKLGPTGDDLAR